MLFRSIYPPDDQEVNLNRMQTLEQAYSYPVGFSDHTLGTCIPLASVAKGACIIEKHFTLDKSLEGWDHKISASPSELQEICQNSLRIYEALGSGRVRRVESGEREAAFRRSIVSTRKLDPGEIICREDLDFKRPASGIAPEFLQFVVGRTVRNTIDCDKPIKQDDLI